jgi:hypothetical protein
MLTLILHRSFGTTLTFIVVVDPKIHIWLHVYTARELSQATTVLLIHLETLNNNNPHQDRLTKLAYTKSHILSIYLQMTALPGIGTADIHQDLLVERTAFEIAISAHCVEN